MVVPVGVVPATAMVVVLAGMEGGTGTEEHRRAFHYIHRNHPGQAAEPLDCENDQVGDEMG